MPSDPTSDFPLHVYRHKKDDYTEMRNDIRRGRHNITASVAQAIQDINRNFVNGNFEDVCSVVGLYKQPGFDPMVLVHWGDLEALPYVNRVLHRSNVILLTLTLVFTLYLLSPSTKPSP